jgi:hypothetical protein
MLSGDRFANYFVYPLAWRVVKETGVQESGVGSQESGVRRQEAGGRRQEAGGVGQIPVTGNKYGSEQAAG